MTIEVKITLDYMITLNLVLVQFTRNLTKQSLRLGKWQKRPKLSRDIVVVQP